MSKKISVSVISFLACLGVSGQSLFAATKVDATKSLPSPNLTATIKEFKLQPRFNIWGFSGDSTLVEGQFLAPLYGNQTRALYLATEGNYVKNDSSWLGGAGLGYRQIINDRIYGGYALADYVSTPHNGFTIINPGVEILGNVWDINVNGYIPLNNKKKLGQVGWAGDTFGDYRYTRPTGHDYYDHYIQQYEEPGRGFDFEVARVIPHFEDAKLHLGAYHFDSADFGSVNGIKGLLTYTLDKYTEIELQDNYDNFKHNQFIVGIRFALGNYSKTEKKQYGLATRLMDPIENRSTLTTGALLPIKKYIDKGERLEHDNVWYFKPGATNNNTGPTGSGTAEDPFIDFNTANYDAINPDIGVIDKYPLMYFTPGQYSFSSFSSNDRFSLTSGWGMYGKTDDYKAPALGDDRAKFSGGLDIKEANEQTTLNSVQIVNDQGSHDDAIARENAALYIKDAANVVLQNSVIKNIDSNSSGGVFYVYGTVVDNSVLNFLELAGSNKGSYTSISGYNKNSSYSSNIADTHNQGYGIYATNNSHINFISGTNMIYGLASSSSSGYSYGYGIYATNKSTINFNCGNNIISGSATTSGYGVYINDHSILNFNGGINTISGYGGDDGYGIRAISSPINFNDGYNTITGDNYGIDAVTLTMNFNGGLNTISGNNYGIQAGERVTINFNGGNNTIIENGYNNDNSSAIHIDDFSTINFINGNNIISGNGYGIYAKDYSTVNFSGGINTIYSNNNSNGDAYGIYANGSTVNFDNSLTTKLNIYASGTTNKYAIYADSYSHIQHNGTDITTSDKNVVNDFITFSTTGSGTGRAIDWKNNWYINWQ